MRALYIVFFMTICFLPSKAQSNAWNLVTFTYLDDPFKYHVANETEAKGSSISPAINFGQLFMVERSFSLVPSFNILAGGGLAYQRLSTDFVASAELINIPDVEAVSSKMSFFNMHYFTIYTGASISKSLSNRLLINFNLRIGAFSALSNNAFGRHFTTVNNVDLTLVESNLIYIARVAPMIMPDLNLSYQFENIPLGFSFGLASFYSPGVYLNGHLFLNGSGESYQVYLYDRIKAVGINVGVQYILK